MKSICKYFSITIFVLLSAPAVAQELRLGLDYDKEIVGNLDLRVKGQIRRNLQSENSTYYIIQPGVSFDVTKRFSVSAAYRLTRGYDYAEEEGVDLIDMHKHRITLDGKYRFKPISENVRLDYRLRYQYTFEEEKSGQYIRNRIRLKYNNTKHSQVFCGVEPYYRLDTRELRQLRVSIGNSYKFDHFKIDVYMLMDGIFNDGSIGSMHQVGLSVSL